MKLYWPAVFVVYFSTAFLLLDSYFQPWADGYGYMPTAGVLGYSPPSVGRIEGWRVRFQYAFPNLLWAALFTRTAVAAHQLLSRGYRILRPTFFRTLILSFAAVLAVPLGSDLITFLVGRPFWIWFLPQDGEVYLSNTAEVLGQIFLPLAVLHATAVVGAHRFLRRNLDGHLTV